MGAQSFWAPEIALHGCACLQEGMWIWWGPGPAVHLDIPMRIPIWFRFQTSINICWSMYLPFCSTSWNKKQKWCPVCYLQFWIADLCLVGHDLDMTPASTLIDAQEILLLQTFRHVKQMKMSCECTANLYQSTVAIANLWTDGGRFHWYAWWSNLLTRYLLRFLKLLPNQHVKPRTWWMARHLQVGFVSCSKNETTSTTMVFEDFLLFFGWCNLTGGNC